jgi:DNA-binding winged helix-turn-helix (wHTH) protein
MLLERPGEVVSREELRTHLWPADTFVDFDHSLNAAVRRLRDALGDTAENPHRRPAGLPFSGSGKRIQACRRF